MDWQVTVQDGKQQERGMDWQERVGEGKGSTVFAGLLREFLLGIWKSRKWKWKRKWKTEMVSNHWTGLLDLPILPLLV